MEHDMNTTATANADKTVNYGHDLDDLNSVNSLYKQLYSRDNLDVATNPD